MSENSAVAAAAVATTAAVVSKPLNDSKPEFARGISIQHARENKTFGTVKSFRINPNARPKINIYADNAEQMHQVTKTGIVKVSFFMKLVFCECFRDFDWAKVCLKLMESNIKLDFFLKGKNLFF